MADQRILAEMKKKSEAEKLWLNYFNESLLAKGIITEEERNHIKHIISSRKPSASGY